MKDCDHDPQPTSDKAVVDGKELTLWACSKCGEMLGWR